LWGHLKKPNRRVGALDQPLDALYGARPPRLLFGAESGPPPRG
jgi:hypothetical protein